MERSKEEIIAQSVKRIDNQKIMISIPDDIGGWWGMTCESIIDMLRGNDVTEIIIPISSNGGSVYEAYQIYNILRAHPAKKTAYLTGKCMSAGTIVACAADEVYSTRACIYMIHKALFGYTGGNADELRKEASILEKNDQIIADILSRKTGMTVEDVLALMGEESYFTPNEALRLGFIDGIVDSIPYDFSFPNDTEFIQTNQSSSYSDYGWLWDRVQDQNANLKTRNYLPMNQTDLSKYKKVLSNPQNQKRDMKFFENIWNAVKGFIPVDKQAEAQEIFAAQNDTVISEIVNAVKDKVSSDIQNSFAKKEDVKVLNLAAFKAVLNEASPEEKREILADLGYESPDAIPSVEENTAFKDMQTELENIKKQVANSVNIQKLNPSNGGGIIPEPQGDGKLSDRAEASKVLLDKMLQNKQIDKKTYDVQISKLK